eukprot:4054436-Pyramimonas_sp.AAC.1
MACLMRISDMRMKVRSLLATLTKWKETMSQRLQSLKLTLLLERSSPTLIAFGIWPPPPSTPVNLTALSPSLRQPVTRRRPCPLFSSSGRACLRGSVGPPEGVQRA